MNAILSIKPEYAKKILDGEKKYEFRKSVFRDPEAVDNIYMYATAPAQLLVGRFTIDEIICAPPRELWKRFGDDSGISQEYFLNYYKSNENGYAIKIGSVDKFAEPVDPNKFIQGFVPPQSFRYVNGELDRLEPVNSTA